MSRSFIGIDGSGSAPSHRAAAKRMYSSCTALTAGVGSNSNKVHFCKRLLRISSSMGKCAMVLRPVTALYLSIWSVASLRLAITPPKRTL